MYRQFYGLSRPPFELTPDPAFYIETPFHNEALANLCYGVEHRKSFVVLTGEAGTGKTLLANHLMRWLSKKEIQFTHIFSPRLQPVEFLQYVLTDLGVSSMFGCAKAELLWQLNNSLLAVHQKGLTTVLIVDEAHLLHWDVLEEIRLLTNLETAEDKLLQIVLIGQPELEQKLDSRELRQLKQRVGLRCRLSPLTELQTADYVEQRLTRAGAQWKIFPEESLARIYQYSHGIPRLINTVCDCALICGYAQQLRFVPPERIEEVAEDFRLTARSIEESGLASVSAARSFRVGARAPHKRV